MSFGAKILVDRTIEFTENKLSEHIYFDRAYRGYWYIFIRARGIGVYPYLCMHDMCIPFYMSKYDFTTWHCTFAYYPFDVFDSIRISVNKPGTVYVKLIYVPIHTVIEQPSVRELTYYGTGTIEVEHHTVQLTGDQYRVAKVIYPPAVNGYPLSRYCFKIVPKDGVTYGYAIYAYGFDEGEYAPSSATLFRIVQRNVPTVACHYPMVGVHIIDMGEPGQVDVYIYRARAGTVGVSV